MGHIGTFGCVVSFACLLIVPIALLVNCDDFRTGEWVFTEKNNYTGWKDQSYASAIGKEGVLLCVVIDFLCCLFCCHSSCERHVYDD